MDKRDPRFGPLQEQIHDVMQAFQLQIGSRKFGILFGQRPLDLIFTTRAKFKEHLKRIWRNSRSRAARVSHTLGGCHAQGVSIVTFGRNPSLTLRRLTHEGLHGVFFLHFNKGLSEVRGYIEDPRIFDLLAKHMQRQFKKADIDPEEIAVRMRGDKKRTAAENTEGQRLRSVILRHFVSVYAALGGLQESAHAFALTFSESAEKDPPKPQQQETSEFLIESWTHYLLTPWILERCDPVMFKAVQELDRGFEKGTINTWGDVYESLRGSLY